MSVPIVLAVAFLLRKNWGRIGLMVLALGPSGLVAYHMLKYGNTYTYQLVVAFLYLTVFFILKSDRVKCEFISANPSDSNANDNTEAA